MKWHCGNISYTSRVSKKRSTKTFVWEKIIIWPVEKCHNGRKARLSTVRVQSVWGWNRKIAKVSTSYLCRI